MKIRHGKGSIMVTRREFLKGLAAAIGAAVLAPEIARAENFVTYYDQSLSDPNFHPAGWFKRLEEQWLPRAIRRCAWMATQDKKQRAWWLGMQGDLFCYMDGTLFPHKSRWEVGQDLYNMVTGECQKFYTRKLVVRVTRRRP
jgi:hypothetical protein